LYIALHRVLYVSAPHALQITLAVLFSSNDTSHIQLYPLSLHDALPISKQFIYDKSAQTITTVCFCYLNPFQNSFMYLPIILPNRSEEHTSELQSRFDLVCRRLLDKRNHIT